MIFQEHEHQIMCETELGNEPPSFAGPKWLAARNAHRLVRVDSLRSGQSFRDIQDTVHIFKRNERGVCWTSTGNCFAAIATVEVIQ